jgi:two-component system chemotaxis response regulator CheY
MKALVVEDDLTNRLLLQNFLTQYGDCQVALNGKEAVKAFRQALEEKRPFNLICMDVVMPEMDGHQAVRVIRNLERKQRVRPSAQVKIIMTTALTDRGNVIMSAREQCDAYMVKPVDTGRLLDHLEAFGLLKLP